MKIGCETECKDCSTYSQCCRKDKDEIKEMGLFEVSISFHAYTEAEANALVEAIESEIGKRDLELDATIKDWDNWTQPGTKAHKEVFGD